MTTENITVQDLRICLEAYWAMQWEANKRTSAWRREIEDISTAEIAAFDALAAKAARTDALEAENAALLAERVELGGIIGSLDSTNAALVKERDQAEAEMSRLARVVADHNSPIEIRDDGVRVRKDRWETGFRNIVTIVRGPRGGFEIDEIVEHIRTLAQAHDKAAQEPVAWMFRSGGAWELAFVPDDGSKPADATRCEPLYAAPQQASEQRAAVDMREAFKAWLKADGAWKQYSEHEWQKCFDYMDHPNEEPPFGRVVRDWKVWQAALAAHPVTKAASDGLKEPDSIWVLTREINEYNQDGEYFVAAFIGKPTREQLLPHVHWWWWEPDCDPVARLLERGGGRGNREKVWFNLAEIERIDRRDGDKEGQS